jgi:hypothetical protein
VNLTCGIRGGEQGTGRRWVPTGVLDQAGDVRGSHDYTKMNVAILGPGVFYIEDGGAVWRPRNRGTLADFLPVEFPAIGKWINRLLPAPNAYRLYKQKICNQFQTNPAPPNVPCKFVCEL